jgi:Na+/H+ antiporter NhaD/arsenite permease-like protein
MGPTAFDIAAHLRLWHVGPFVGLLLLIAILPLACPRWWESNLHKLLVSGLAALPVAVLFGWFGFATPAGLEAGARVMNALHEYASFIVLLGSLYVVSGGVHLSGDLEARPLVNTAFLAGGAILSNVIGTTGASMLLIRPVLRTNSERRYTVHVPIFFIFLVSNIGGALTPVGDPPLFLGYLRGVPFFWTAVHVWPVWLVTVGLVLLVFFGLDSWFYRKEPRDLLRADVERVVPLRLSGKRNILLLGGIVASVLFLSPVEGHHDLRSYFLREIVMIAMAAASWIWTPRAPRAANRFTFGPILEVAAIFLGVFLTMIPATMLLAERGGVLGVTAPWQYFWASGLLSSFLDNAPTYVAFTAMACGSVGPLSCTSAEHLGTLATGTGAPLLAAISCGAVFMGANSYIGNGPNFMVKAIADQVGYRMPNFFGYCGWALAVLVPIFGLVTLLFFT